ncbi:MAG: hypothetical protein EPO25_06755 [Gammaproteobacteria bacterium]|nr:MAG: hypothetical protein EPO25_06755 [Gammaproteobacteria bacterium]
MGSERLALTSWMQGLSQRAEEENILGEFVETTASAVGAHLSALFVILPNGRDLWPVSWYGMEPAAAVRFHCQVGKCLVGMTATEKRIMASRNLVDDPRIHYSSLMESEGMVSALLAPVEQPNQVLGVLVAAWRSEIEPSREQSLTMTSLASAAAALFGVQSRHRSPVHELAVNFRSQLDGLISQLEHGDCLAVARDPTSPEEDLIRRVLCEEPASPEEAASLAGLLGLSFRYPYRLILVGRRGGQPLPAESRHFSRTALPPDTVIFEESQRLLIFLPVRPTHADGGERIAKETASGLKGALTKRHPAIDVAAGISLLCRMPPEIRRRHQEALRSLQALDESAFFSASGDVLSFGEMGVYGDLFADNRSDSLVRFAEQLLGPLASYDASHGTAFTESLDVFCKMNGNLQGTAREMYIHSSSLRYRLQRIQDICKVNLNDPEDRFRIQLALTVARYRGLRGRQVLPLQRPPARK